MNGVLVVVPCAKAKVWDRHRESGAVPARDAYTGSPFGVNRQYAEHFGEKWVILSAKYGFICPGFLIPGTYNVRFGQGSADEVTPERLRKQARDLLGYRRFCHVIVLGGEDYLKAAEGAFASLPLRLHFPFRGLNLFEAMAATKHAVLTGDPGVHVCG